MTTDSARILIIDDDEAVRASLSLLLKHAGYTIATADGHGSALEAAKTVPPNLFVLDMNFSANTSGDEGLVLLRELHELYPTRPVILITAWGSIPLAVEGMKRGARDFITKPWNNDQFLRSVRTALSLSSSDKATGTKPAAREDLDKTYDFEKLIGCDEKFLEVLRTVARVCATDAPVLIEGESGTGKELVAEAIHANSRRVEGPFVRVNLGGIPATLFESEMFGHKKGAFTGAAADRIGRFELADGGTIFLDEIGELDPASQVKLLRVLQDHSFEVLGTSISRSSDFRLVSATNRDLEKQVGERKFREDLYYRINLIKVQLPALRDRRSDIPLLTAHFVDNLKELYDRPQLTVSRAAMDRLKAHPWPGNIRQLKNVVERTVLVSTDNLLDEADFMRQLDRAPQMSGTIELPAVGTVTLDQMEESMIRKALDHHDHNLSRVARSLGLSRAALYRRLEKYGISL
ncbi:MAG TPA: sigma-54 dependent transcriptional regulator [candidate division Zixibacteria bacterium]|nr:sigma-54 dependent transcriptional regulator [candidate division Zixibacteria bacterium]